VPAAKLSSILKKHRGDLALIVGNGINMFGAARTTNSWAELLVSLSKKMLGDDSEIPAGISHTEFYDLIDLRLGSRDKANSLQKEFCNLMESWAPYDHHKQIVSWAQRANCQLLTTNFEKILSEAGKCRLLRIGTTSFTDYYPWDSYYGTKQLDNPCAGFGIWHINGMEHYPRSIRLGLSHYMGSAEKARRWLYKGKSKRLFSGKSLNDWGGAQTWLQIVFCKPIAIFGLALEQNEVFLRWLLIERARYYRNFPEQKMPAWYFYVSDKENPGKITFLKHIGISPIKVKNYDELYGSAVWQ
jgi:hypothetical protein